MIAPKWTSTRGLQVLRYRRSDVDHVSRRARGSPHPPTASTCGTPAKATIRWQRWENVERKFDRANRTYEETYYDPETGAVVFHKEGSIDDQSIHGQRGKAG